MIGRTISHYEIVEKLGEGGMGAVYKAKDLRLPRFVALKFLPPHMTGGAEKQRFMQEAEAVSALDHPNICSIHEIDETPDGQLFIVMPCYEGESLETRVKRGPLKLDDALDIALQAASGLAKAHEKGIVHRDIKPGNIFITGDGLVKIVDFGLAKLGGRTKLTQTGTMVGTAAYMSPEQVRGSEIDERTDIWSLGVVLYEMIAGRLPFKGDYEQAVAYSIVNEVPAPIRDSRSDVPAGVERIIEKMLAKDPGGRYRNISDVRSSLQSFKGQLKSGAPCAADGSREKLPSIAVLPFVNMSPDAENQYFGDGLAEELINALAQLEGVHVAARTSAFRFRGEDVDIREIGEKLHVNTVLEGSVRRAGNRLRITAQLINIEDGYHLWSKRFDRDMKDIFDIQDEITRAIVDQLEVELVGPKTKNLVSCCTENLEAYSLFLKGRYYWNSLTPEGWRKSIELLTRAIELDPSFALAYASLSYNYGSQLFWGNEEPEQTILKSRAAAERAIELDDNLGLAYGSLANILWFHDWDFDGAERKFKRALELDPGLALGRTNYSLFLACRGRAEEAIAEARLCLKLDPLSSLVAAWAAGALYGAGRYEEAIDTILKAAAMDPDHWQLYFHLGSSYLHASMKKEAVEALEKAVDLSGGASAALSVLASAYYVSGNIREADRLLERLNERAKSEYVSPQLLAIIYAARKEPEIALAHMRRAIEKRDVWVAFNSILPRMIRLGGPEVDALLEKAGLRVVS